MGKKNGMDSYLRELNGAKALRAISKFEDRCEKQTEKGLPKWGVKAPKCYECLGQVLAYADLIGSCAFGCPGPSYEDHTVLYLPARASSFGRAALRLAKMGFYDEALNIVRSVGEIGNLLALFASDANAIDEWKKSDWKYRMENMSPSKVRKRVLAANGVLAMQEQTYKELCEISTHPVPQLRPQQFNHAAKTMTGGMFVQPAGFVVVLNELAISMSLLVLYATLVCRVPGKERKIILAECAKCVRATGSLNIGNVSEALKQGLKTS